MGRDDKPPAPVASEEELEEALSRPSPSVVETLSATNGDVIVVGASGKMGPTLARMARRALDEGGSTRAVFAVGRFSEPNVEETLRRAGVRTLRRDLLDGSATKDLPDAGAVVFMAGAKFGTGTAAATTWATNCVASSLVAERYAGVPTVVFSTGNVYPLVPVASGGATEETPPEPIGEYAQSALGRERIFEFFSRTRGTPVAIVRLNYAIELRYGVLLDVARAVWSGSSVDVRMGYFNCIWQGDANAQALRSLGFVRSPPFVVNVTGPHTVSARSIARRFAERFGRSANFCGEEAATALLSDAARAQRLFGPPETDLETMVDWVAEWVRIGGRTLGKPTHFETRDGKF